jgi:hypothetical protein
VLDKAGMAEFDRVTTSVVNLFTTEGWQQRQKVPLTLSGPAHLAQASEDLFKPVPVNTSRSYEAGDFKYFIGDVPIDKTIPRMLQVNPHKPSPLP